LGIGQGAFMTPVHRPRSRNAFTLLEMLVVIGIITLLTAILIPVVSQVRMRGFVAQTQGEMQRIMIACQAYYHDFNAYPGPLGNNQIAGSASYVTSGITVDSNAKPAPTAFDPVAPITSSENLTLGLLGLLSPYPTGPSQPFPPIYLPPPPKHDVLSLVYWRPVSYHYLDFLPDEIPTASGSDYFAYGPTSGGSYQTDYNPNPVPPPNNLPEMVSDSSVPEFMDHIPTPMPILYVRAIPGATGVVDDGKQPTPAPYNFKQLAPYGFLNIKVADYAPPTGVTEPAYAVGWYTYFMNPSVIGQPRGKDAFILICAGPDRLFGTKDDIIVTP
jgi:prepilin-type N-terminal cleavage/methylation domain-containing protein